MTDEELDKAILSLHMSTYSIQSRARMGLVTASALATLGTGEIMDWIQSARLWLDDIEAEVKARSKPQPEPQP